MSYTSRHRYKSRREKLKQNQRNLRVFFIFGVIIVSLLVYRNWSSIYDWFVTTFQ